MAATLDSKLDSSSAPMLDKKLSALSDLIARCLPALRSDNFAKELIMGLRQLVPIDDASVLYYARGDLPTLVYHETPKSRSASNMERFLAGAFLLDPFYKAAAEDRRFGVFLLKELSPERFRDSEYYHSWYRNCGFSDECGFLVEVGKDAFVNVALGRLQQRRFSQVQLRTLRSLQTAVEELCRQHWAAESGSGEGIRKHLHLALDDFGSSLLTERETQVINLVLHGHSTKSVAQRLSISVETVKLHRKHAYAKLEVSSQAELFYLFLDSLMSARDYRGGDTLVSYLAKPERKSYQ
ncbi:LuxR C-terminal-related transcriptional regulator [Congregibacter variabilis]|uniref:LuxR C-terminal-related transcriptional regulator n=1 Tax=Congregibacter variabilis TaxID=3081200 RepID=A0ABZ0HYE8_9GAMM|nr:LuxR C-terminal-related transcriptional regulator [Congregibacter sp. IMCC43200]